jgi:hypothetical protein
MFKKLIQSISKSRTTQAEVTKEAPPPIKKPQAAPPPPAKVKDLPAAPPPPPAPVAKKAEPAAAVPTPAVAANGVANAASAVAPAAAAPVVPAAEAKPVVKKSIEELCAVEPKMSKDQIRERIKLIYRRYNRAASSLDAATRAEAEVMLDAVVALREKTFGEI